MLNAPAGRPACRNSCANASAVAGVYSAGFHTTAFPHSERRHQVPRRHGDREVPGRDDRRDTDRRAEREELLVRHLRRHGLAVEPASLAQEEVARVDDLLNLASRLRDRLADLPREEPRRAPLRCPRPAARAVGSARPRTGAGTAAHAGWAARAMRQASTNVSASPNRASATVRERSDGLGTLRRPPGASLRDAPPMIEATVRVMASMLPRLN